MKKIVNIINDILKHNQASQFSKNIFRSLSSAKRNSSLLLGSEGVSLFANLHDKLNEKLINKNRIIQKETVELLHQCNSCKNPLTDIPMLVKKIITDKNHQKQFFFLIPIYNLIIAKDVNNEIMIGNTLFVDTEKIPRIRKRLNLPFRVSYIKKKMDGRDILTKAPSYAYISVRANNEDIAQRIALAEVRKNLYLLMSCQFQTTKRYNLYRFGCFHTQFNDEWDQTLRWEKGKKDVNISEKRCGTSEFILNKHILSSPKKIFFIDFLKLKEGEWKGTIEKTIILIGKSMLSDSIDDALIYNVRAIEALLKEGRKDTTGMIVDKIEALFHWALEFNKQRFEEIYKKRCNITHEGAYEEGTCEDLVYLDEVIFNLLNIICKLNKTVKCKNDITKYTKKYFAYKVLKKKMPLEPEYRKVYYSPITYSEKEIEKLEMSYYRII